MVDDTLPPRAAASDFPDALGGFQDRYEVAEFIPSKTVSHVKVVKKG